MDRKYLPTMILTMVGVYCLLDSITSYKFNVRIGELERKVSELERDVELTNRVLSHAQKVYEQLEKENKENSRIPPKKDAQEIFGTLHSPPFKLAECIACHKHLKPTPPPLVLPKEWEKENE